MKNYRPISLTSICCKILEHIIYSAIFQYLNSINYLTPSQHGFRSGFSCNAQLVEFQHYISQALDNNTPVDAIFLDFRKAFDTVPHNLLDNKLASLNINYKIHSWIRNYLHAREQCVVLNSHKSCSIAVSSGVPQGSVLGPLLFLICINNITENIKSEIKLFADDCVIYRQINSLSDTYALQKDLETVAWWCDGWGMNLNIEKCNHLRFTRKSAITQESYKIKDTIITSVTEYKYLGVYLTQSLKWIKHVEYIITKASRMLYFIRRNFKDASTEVKETLYFMHVRSILDYACVVWDPHQEYLIERLEKLQNQAARFVTNKYDPFASISAIKATLNWEPLQFRRIKLRLKFFHCIYYNRTGIDKKRYLLEPNYISLRHDNPKKVREYSHSTNILANSFFPKTISDWNMLSEELVSLQNNDLFFSRL